MVYKTEMQVFTGIRKGQELFDAFLKLKLQAKMLGINIEKVYVMPFWIEETEVICEKLLGIEISNVA